MANFKFYWSNRETIISLLNEPTNAPLWRCRLNYEIRCNHMFPWSKGHGYKQQAMRLLRQANKKRAAKFKAAKEQIRRSQRQMA